MAHPLRLLTFFSREKKVSKEKRKVAAAALALIGRADKPPLTGALPPYPRTLVKKNSCIQTSFTFYNVWEVFFSREKDSSQRKAKSRGGSASFPFQFYCAWVIRVDLAVIVRLTNRHVGDIFLWL
ncbi:MAG: hypothetical protein E7058_03735 [Lentisphaerae bacterium]|nr:hypothetical protein [Lentisphaerota bacterium]